MENEYHSIGKVIRYDLTPIILSRGIITHVDSKNPSRQSSYLERKNQSLIFPQIMTDRNADLAQGSGSVSQEQTAAKSTVDPTLEDISESVVEEGASQVSPQLTVEGFHEYPDALSGEQHPVSINRTYHPGSQQEYFQPLVYHQLPTPPQNSPGKSPYNPEDGPPASPYDDKRLSSISLTGATSISNFISYSVYFARIRCIPFRVPQSRLLAILSSSSYDALSRFTICAK
jgi:hypothetical protein